MDKNERSSSDEPAHKKQRVLACRRCRHRKQRCEDDRPCANCAKAGAECVPTDPAPRPQADPEYVRRLEDQVAELRAAKVPAPSVQPFDMRIANPLPVYEPHLGGAANGDPSRRMSYSFGAPESNERHASAQTFDAQVSKQGPGSGVPIDAPAAHFRRASELTSSTTFEAVAFGQSPAQHPNSAKRSHSQISPAANWNPDESDDEVDYLMPVTIAADPSSQGGPSESPASAQVVSPMNPRQPPILPTGVPPHVEEMWFEAYRDRAQSQYPFFHWPTFLKWVHQWKAARMDEGEPRMWQGFFVNLVYATALVLKSERRPDRILFYRAGVTMLPLVLREPDPILHLQAYLLLLVHALHRSSTQRILSLASTTMRYCVQNQLHLAETEPTSQGTLVDIQIRRRCFWSAYNLDRLVMSSLHVPPSIPDNVITTKLYANIDDDDLDARAAAEHGLVPPREIPENPAYTRVSSSLHVVQCRRIQSEIAGYTLRADYHAKFEDSPKWRQGIQYELDQYKKRLQSVANPQPHAKGHTSKRWLGVFYNYTILMLWRPTRQSVLTGEAGDKSVQASCQACLIFRKSQMDRQVAQAWLGLLVQFQSGITLLYCFWATPPQYRTESYYSKDVGTAIRYCSNILAVFATQWPKADCIRDVFELLASEIPLQDRHDRPPVRISEGAAAEVREKLPGVRALVVHRPVLRLIEEMISEDFPRCEGRNPVPPPLHPPPQRYSGSGNPSREDSPTRMMGMAKDKTRVESPAMRPYQMGSPVNPYDVMPFSDETQQMYPMVSGGMITFDDMMPFNFWE